jgi:LCP family protein required for cell wall assembly
LKENNIDSIDKVKNKKIGIIEDKNSIDGYVIPNEIINEKKLDSSNEIIKYSVFSDLLKALYDKEVDLIFVSSNYATLFSSVEGYHNIKDETSVVYTKTKEKEKEIVDHKNIEEPFTILLMGVDSTLESINSGSAFNGDALMLITFNPKTLNATMLSIPRDTYVPITCFKNNRENKITHAAWYGESCMISTIENFTGIKIDYYAKINFKGVVKLVDALGGIYADVPYSFCEQNSNRDWGKNTVFVEKGTNKKLNGEQALALARNRHKANDGSDVGHVMARYCASYTEGDRNDLTRGKNQQIVINGIINQIKNINNLDKVYSLLDVMSMSIDTNMSTDKILSLYNVAKKALLNNNGGDIVSFDSLHLLGYDKYIYDTEMKLTLYNYYYNRQSLRDIVKAMNVNLEKVKPTMIKTFSFSPTEIYEKKVIGKGPYKYEAGLLTLPNFVGNKQSEAINWGNSNGITVNIQTEEVTDKNKDGIIIKQSLPWGYIVKDMNPKSLTITVGKYKEEVKEPIDCTKEENKNNALCLIPDFSTYTIEQAKAWKNNQKSSIMIEIKEITIDDPLYDPTKAGKFYNQSVKAGKNITDVKEIIITFYEKEE